MSKKDKSKFKKRIHSQLLEEMAKSQSQPKIRTQMVLQTDTFIPSEISDKKPQFQTQVKSTISEIPKESNNSLRYVKSDLKKSAIIIGSIIVVIVALYFIDNKTNILITLSDKIFRTININI